jgi:hypothetical protein
MYDPSRAAVPSPTGDHLAGEVAAGHAFSQNPEVFGAAVAF